MVGESALPWWGRKRVLRSLWGWRAVPSGNPTEWARSLQHLLSDPVGVKTYMNFLDEEFGCSSSLTFFFACEGLGKQSPDNLHQLLPLIWKKFIRNYSVPVSPGTHASLAEKIHNNDLSPDMFRTAQKEVYNHMSENTYPSFLQCQLFIDKLQEYQHKSSVPCRYSEDSARLDMSELFEQGLQKDELILDQGAVRGTYFRRELSTLHEHEVVPPSAPSNTSMGALCQGVEGLLLAAAREARDCQPPVRLTSRNLAATAMQRAVEMPKTR